MRNIKQALLIVCIAVGGILLFTAQSSAPKKWEYKYVPAYTDEGEKSVEAAGLYGWEAVAVIPAYDGHPVCILLKRLK